MADIQCCHMSFDRIYLPNKRLEEAVNTVAKQNEMINEELSALNNQNTVTGEGKKAFVEPTISVPVDVLEATTFFQAASSGATN